MDAEPRLGFLAVVDIESLGSCGGLLVTNLSGRPLEFHCTAPVSANRAQQILYGQTLQSFVHCDQIGAALLAKVKTRLDALVVDSEILLQLDSTIPIACLTNIHASKVPIKPASNSPTSDYPLPTDGNDQPIVANAERWLDRFQSTLPLAEPFERIREAIGEAHKVAA